MTEGPLAAECCGAGLAVAPWPVNAAALIVTNLASSALCGACEAELIGWGVELFEWHAHAAMSAARPSEHELPHYMLQPGNLNMSSAAESCRSYLKVA